MADATNGYPLPKFHFSVQWGDTQMGFTEVSGLDFETEVIEYRHGVSPIYNKTKQPGLTKYSNITLKRGTFKSDNDFQAWWKETKMFRDQKIGKTVIISLLDDAHEPLITWTIARAWPTKIQHTDLKADANEIAIETMELVHEGLSVEFK